MKPARQGEESWERRFDPCALSRDERIKTFPKDKVFSLATRSPGASGARKSESAASGPVAETVGETTPWWERRQRNSTLSLRQVLYVVPLAFLLSAPVEAIPFDCASADCGLPGDGPYPHLVVGAVRRVADESDAEAVFRRARTRGYWAALPDDLPGFIRAIQMMSIEIPGADGPEEITLLMGREHFDAIKIAAGDLVRYIPHPPGHSAPPSNDPAAAAYWSLFGCIAVLCRAQDRLCPARHVQGVYGLGDGVQLDAHTRAPLAGGARVDPGTYLPIGSVGR